MATPRLLAELYGLDVLPEFIVLHGQNGTIRLPSNRYHLRLKVAKAPRGALSVGGLYMGRHTLKHQKKYHKVPGSWNKFYCIETNKWNHLLSWHHLSSFCFFFYFGEQKNTKNPGSEATIGRVARCLVSEPLRCTFTCVCHSMQWAFVRITRRFASIMKPEPLERYCRRRCHGKEKLGVLWTHQTSACRFEIHELQNIEHTKRAMLHNGHLSYVMLLKKVPKRNRKKKQIPKMVQRNLNDGIQWYP